MTDLTRPVARVYLLSSPDDLMNGVRERLSGGHNFLAYADLEREQLAESGEVALENDDVITREDPSASIVMEAVMDTISDIRLSFNDVTINRPAVELGAIPIKHRLSGMVPWGVEFAVPSSCKMFLPESEFGDAADVNVVTFCSWFQQSKTSAD